MLDPVFRAGLRISLKCRMDRVIKLNQTIAAHFDGKHILLDEAVELEPNTKLLVTVLPKDEESEQWRALSVKRLGDARLSD